MILLFVIIIRALKTRHVYNTKNLHTLFMSWIRYSQMHTLKEEVRVIWGKELWAPFHPVFA